MNNNEKSKNIIIVILIVMVIGLAGLLCYQTFVVNKESKDNNEVNKSETNAGTDTNQTMDSSNTVIDNNTNSSSGIKELDLSKSLNTTGVSYSNASDKEGDYGLSISINSDKKSATLSIDWKKFCPIVGDTVCSQSVEKYQIIGFSKNITSGFVGDLGQDPKGITLFFIMSDGTVEYMPMFSDIYNMNYTYEKSADGRVIGEHFESKGLVEDVSGIIKIYNVSASNGAGWSTVIGARTDGSFYDLGHIVSK